MFTFPVSGRAQFVLTWDDFTIYFNKTTRTGAVKSRKDFYWDSRPKPEFGTLEIRVFDTPLTVPQAAALSVLVQALSAWFMHDQPYMPQEDDYLIYTCNRFQACRFGLDAVYVDPATGTQRPPREHIWLTFSKIEVHAQRLGPSSFISMLHNGLERDQNDARWLRERQAEESLLAEVVQRAAQRFQGDAAYAQEQS